MPLGMRLAFSSSPIASTPVMPPGLDDRNMIGGEHDARLPSMTAGTGLLIRSPKELVAFVCGAQVLVQIGAFFWPALLPGIMPLWRLSNSEAGWITASFYGAYMIAVPVLVTLTDRVDPKRVYLFGVAAT